ncbi:nitrogen regulation protein NR(I) [Methylophilales bacterium MBRSG12]|uniref:DNA-binding transcriptional regulator NtrC n=1 Tax=Methylophilales bacterium MBRS-H7 TaxID=1623450 RepID=A0A0H4J1M0_9PROT|nr:nitrogen regulation protein NR(I) [Methylophilales bacterium MBRSF5]AKO65925.1 nitrogen regulation protein NR(I) [Methylophilales bacterium MBRS-H7]AKO67245.1 nitrogen regulation protein NR(I) [Methylophilales bacterium MBRSG12]
MDSSKKKIWILDDDKSIRWVLQKALEKNNYTVLAFGNTNEAINQFNHDMPDLIVSDVKMPGESGLQFLEKVKGKFPNIPVIIMTAFSDLDSAVDSYSHGAYEYLPKPFDIDNAISVINSAFKDEADELNDIDSTNKIIGTSKAMQEVFKQIGKLSKSDASILITGESGTGKELVAKAIHDNSLRKDKPFIALNSAAIPKDLLESELFGYEKGAFTGANVTKKGYFEEAQDGTLFLDEIADMPIDLQSKLLRVLNDGSFQKLGSSSVIKANVKIIAATHQNLQEKINNQSFREDLFHRLNVITIHLPPLRERDNDIPLLAKFFLNQSAKELKTNSKYLNEETQDYFKKLNWTGNIRQLRNICHWLTVMSPGKEVGISDLPAEILKENIYNKPSNNWEESIKLVIQNDLSNNVSDLYDLYLEKLESILIKESLNYCGGKKINAANILGIGRNTITRKIKELNISSDQ